MEIPVELKNAAEHCSGRQPISCKVETRTFGSGKRRKTVKVYSLTFATKSRNCERVATFGNWVVQMMPYVTIIALGVIVGCSFHAALGQKTNDVSGRTIISHTMTAEFIQPKK